MNSSLIFLINYTVVPIAYTTKKNPYTFSKSLSYGIQGLYLGTRAFDYCHWHHPEREPETPKKKKKNGNHGLVHGPKNIERNTIFSWQVEINLVSLSHSPFLRKTVEKERMNVGHSENGQQPCQIHTCSTRSPFPTDCLKAFQCWFSSLKQGGVYINTKKNCYTTIHWKTDCLALWTISGRLNHAERACVIKKLNYTSYILNRNNTDQFGFSSEY